MKKIVFFVLFPLYLFSLSNPYTDFPANEKLNIMLNHFLNISLENIRPEFPQKKSLKDDGATLDPVKYELYFNYIQRLKAIRESRAKEQLKIDEDYIGKLGFYNGKLKTLKKFYLKDENLYPLLQDSINKAFKIVFGKPHFTSIVYNEEVNRLEAKISSIKIYDVADFKPLDLELFVYKGMRDEFIKYHDESDIKVRFDFDGEYLIFKDVIFEFNGNEYVGKFLGSEQRKIKLNIKINDDIFQAVKIGEIK